MGITIIKLYDIIVSDEIKEEEIEELLLNFCGKTGEKCDGACEVEKFIQKRAIHFENLDNSRTHLVFNDKTYELLGYFAITPKTWDINQRNYKKLTPNQMKKLGLRKNKDEKNYKISGYFIGQLGLNYQDGVRNNNSDFTGKHLLDLAFKTIKEGYKIVGGRITWLECLDVEGLKIFYEKFGFVKVKEYVSENGLLIYFKRTKDLPDFE